MLGECSGIPLIIIVWSYATFDSNFGIEFDFTKRYEGELLIVVLITYLLEIFMIHKTYFPDTDE